MKARDITSIAIMVAIISICSWIAIPSAVPFTLQTFGIFAALMMLGGKRGTVAIAVYIFLGIIGIPVFAGFQSGLGHILGSTGGYVLGFILMGAIYAIGENHTGSKGRLLFLVIGLLICYVAGTVWFIMVSTDSESFWAVVAICVLPYIIPDLVKLILADRISVKIKKAFTI